APLRPEIVRDQTAQFAVVQKPLSALERIYNQVWLRKIVMLVVLALIWEAYGRYLNNDLLFPTFTATMRAFIESIVSGVLPARAWASIKVLLMGYACGVVLAAALAALAIVSRIGTVFLVSMRSLFNPLSAVVLVVE